MTHPFRQDSGPRLEIIDSVNHPIECRCLSCPMEDVKFILHTIVYIRATSFWPMLFEGRFSAVSRPAWPVYVGRLSDSRKFEELTNIAEHMVRPPAQRLGRPLLRIRHTGGHSQTDGPGSAGHNHFDQRIIAYNRNSPHGHAELLCHESQGIQRWLAGENQWSAGHSSHGRGNGVGITHRLARRGGEKWHV